MTKLKDNMSNTSLNTKQIDFKNPVNSLTDLLVRTTSIFGKLYTRGICFDTFDVLGAHSGTSEPSGFINHRRTPCGESKTKIHTPLSTIFVLPLYTHQDTSVSSFGVSLTH